MAQNGDMRPSTSDEGSKSTTDGDDMKAGAWAEFAQVNPSPTHQHKKGRIEGLKRPRSPLPEPSELCEFYYEELVPSNNEEIRLLVLFPHMGLPDSPVQCQIIKYSLVQDPFCFIAVRNTRGYKHLTTDIIVDGKRKAITRYLEAFLRYIRWEKRVIPLYIREVCIDRENPSERDFYLNAPMERYVFDHACCLLDLDVYVDVLIERGVIPPESYKRKKVWDNYVTERDPKDHEITFPKHFPIHLGVWRGMDASPIPHRYLPLDVLAGEIRLVGILPSDHLDAPLVGQLAHEPLAGEVIYHALSYAWGSSEKTSEIILNGQNLPITSSLDAFLRHIRLPQSTVVVWVDAICIDQENIREKGRQVQRMHAIYENADGVLIWLGEENEESNVAMDFVAEISKPENTIFQAETLDNPKTSPRLSSTPRLARCWAALHALVQRPWFKRQWIIQELAFASLPTIMCGGKTCSWGALHEAVLVLNQCFSGVRQMCKQHLDNDLASDRNMVIELTMLRNLQKADMPPTFLSQSLLTRDSSCQDPRDKIYGILHMASDTKALGLRPDYAKPVQQLYVDFVRAYIESTRSLDIICAVQHAFASSDLPSWCPDWRQPTCHRNLVRDVVLGGDHETRLQNIDESMFSAARNTKACTGLFDDQKALVCAGFVGDIVKSVAPFRSGPGQWLDLASKIELRNGRPIDHSRISREFWSMLVGDATSSFLPGDIPQEDDDDDGMSMMVQYRPGNGDKSKRFRPLEQMEIERVLFITEKGYMGLASPEVEPGMQVCVLLGCSVPVLLNAHEGHQHFVGACFVQGWMLGELLDEMEGSDEDILNRVTKEHPFVLY